MVCLQEISGVLPAALGVAAAAGVSFVVLSEVTSLAFSLLDLLASYLC